MKAIKLLDAIKNTSGENYLGILNNIKHKTSDEEIYLLKQIIFYSRIILA